MTATLLLSFLSVVVCSVAVFVSLKCSCDLGMVGGALGLGFGVFIVATSMPIGTENNCTSSNSVCLSLATRLLFPFSIITSRCIGESFCIEGKEFRSITDAVLTPDTFRAFTSFMVP